LELKEQDRNAKKDFKNVLDLARQGGLEHGFDEGDFFAGPDAVVSHQTSVTWTSLTW
jgi:ERO1-like protein alpha